jgi:hypothetical protein
MEGKIMIVLNIEVYDTFILTKVLRPYLLGIYPRDICADFQCNSERLGRMILWRALVKLLSVTLSGRLQSLSFFIINFY